MSRTKESDRGGTATLEADPGHEAAPVSGPLHRAGGAAPGPKRDTLDLARERLRDMTFEEAEEARLPSDWLTARDDSRRSWEHVRAAARDAWTRDRSEHGL